MIPVKFDQTVSRELFQIMTKASLESLSKGDILQGRVQQMENSILLIKLLDGTFFTAKVPDNFTASKGEQITLEIGEKQGEQLTARILAGETGAKSSANLENLQLTETISRNLSSQGVTPTEKLISDAADLLKTEPELNAKQAAFIVSNSMDPNPEMLKILQRISENEFMLHDSLQSLKEGLQSGLVKMNGEDRNILLRPLFITDELDRLSQELNKQLSNVQPEIRQNIVHNIKELLTKALLDETSAAEQAGGPINLDQKDIEGILRNLFSDKNLTEAPNSNGKTLFYNSTGSDGNNVLEGTVLRDSAALETGMGLKEGTSLRNGADNKTKSITGTETESKPSPENHTGLEKNPDPELRILKNAGLQTAVKPEAGGDNFPLEPDELNNVLKAVNKALEDIHTKTVNKSDIGDKEIEALLDKFFDKAVIKAENGGVQEEETGIREKARALDKIMEFSQNAIGRMDNDIQESTLQAFKEINQAFKFFNQVTTYDSMLQIPIKINNEDTTGELYVMKRKNGRKKLDEENFALFLSLMTQNLGRVESFLNASSKVVTINFRVEDEGLATLVRNEHRALYDGLLKKGYKLAELKCRLLENGKTDMFDAALKTGEFLGLKTKMDLRI